MDYTKPSGYSAGVVKARTAIHDVPAADDHQKGSEYFLKTYYKDVSYDTSHATDKDRLNSWQEYRNLDGALTSSEYYQVRECDDSLRGINDTDLSGGPGNPYPPFIADSTYCASYEPRQASYERIEQKLSQTLRSVDHPLSVLRAVGEGKSLGEAMGDVVLPGPGGGATEPMAKRYGGHLPMDGAKMRLTTAASGFGFGVGGGYNDHAAHLGFPPSSTSPFATAEPHGKGFVGISGVYDPSKSCAHGCGPFDADKASKPLRMASPMYREVGTHDSESGFMSPMGSTATIRGMGRAPMMRLETATTAAYGMRHGTPLSAAIDGDILRSVHYSRPRLAHEPAMGEHEFLYVREMPKHEIDAYFKSDGVKSPPVTGPVPTGVSAMSGFTMPVGTSRGVAARPAGLAL